MRLLVILSEPPRIITNQMILHPSTIRLCLTHVKTFYRTYELEVPNISNKVLCTKESHETIGDFIRATKDYHKSDDLQDVLKELEHNEGVVPTWYIVRVKTNYPYYTFNSSEAKAIVRYLMKNRGNAQDEEPLFPIGVDNLSTVFNRVNEVNGWGRKETRVFFHSHALRKFFATQLIKAGLDFLKILWMSGRQVDKTTNAYFKADPTNWKREYMRVMDKLSINKVKVHDVHTKEYESMKTELDKLQEKFKSIQEENSEFKLYK